MVAPHPGFGLEVDLHRCVDIGILNPVLGTLSIKIVVFVSILRSEIGTLCDDLSIW